MNTRTFIVVLVLGAFGACATTDKAASSSSPESATEVAPDAAILEQGRELTRQFYDREIDALWERMSAQMIEAMGGKGELASFRDQVEGQLGSETEVLEEQTTTSGAYQVYARKASFSKIATPVVVQWTLDPEGAIAGFFIRPVQ